MLKFHTDPIADRLSELTILGELRGRERRKFARHFEPIDASAGSVLITEDTLNHFTYFILEGEVDVYVDGEKVASLGPDSVVGERTLLGEVATNAQVVTATPVRALAVDHRVLRALADTHPSIKAALVDTAQRRAGVAA